MKLPASTTNVELRRWLSNVADRQARKAYAWQHSWLHWNSATSTKRAVRSAIRRAERYYKVGKSSIQFLASARTTDNAPGASVHTYHWHVDRHHIALRPGHQNIPIALHETAHAICTVLFRDSVEDHGREWLGVFMWLLEKEQIAPVSALHLSAKAYGLKWISAKRIGPKMVRKTYAKRIRKLRKDAQNARAFLVSATCNSC